MPTVKVPLPPPLSTIREVREALGVSQALLSRVTGVSPSTISRIEAGTLTPGYDTATTIFLALSHLSGSKKALRAGDEDGLIQSFQATLPELLRGVTP